MDFMADFKTLPDHFSGCQYSLSLNEGESNISEYLSASSLKLNVVIAFSPFQFLPPNRNIIRVFELTF